MTEEINLKEDLSHQYFKCPYDCLNFFQQSKINKILNEMEE